MKIISKINSGLIIKSYKKVIILVSALILNTGNFTTVANSETGPLEILFIGSSYFNFNNLPGIVKNLAENSDKDVYIDQYIRLGLFLDDHAGSSITEEKINERNWDFVILQGVGVLIAYPDYDTRHPVYPALVTLKNKIRENCESTKIIYCLPWAFEDGMTWVEGWTDTYEDMQIEIYNNTLQYANYIGFTIAPVGWSWYQVLDEKNYPLHYLHLSDWNHPSLKGSYLMACVIYSTIFIQSTVEIPYYAGLEVSDASYFQTVAGNIVLNDTVLWDITSYTDTTMADITMVDTTSTAIHELKESQKSTIYQNFPNPFRSVTQIKYELYKESNVEIEVFDLTGKKIAALINKYNIPGSYSVEFNGNDLNSGIYFYSLKTDDGFQIKKMQLIK
ncbi:MAG: T9SS type A sorting domain-containing protein [Bacteroidales bacterium]|nr:T9SS type A sorting domain-containing protein [Bacteroidales bacterium]